MFAEAFELFICIGKFWLSRKVEGGDKSTMNQQIRVTANGRGEMRIAWQVKAKVSNIIRMIDSLRLCPEDQFMYGMFIGFMTGFGNKLIKRMWQRNLSFGEA